jgi:hypothetical protein
MNQGIRAALWGFAVLAAPAAGWGAEAEPARVLEGTLQGGVYTAPDGSFSIAAPFEEGSDAFRAMEVQEVYGPDAGYVSFVPTDGRDIYRVNLSRHGTPASHGVPLRKVAPLVLRIMGERLEQAYGTALVRVRRADLTLADRPAEFWEFTQEVPGARLSGDGGPDESHRHYVYVVDAGDAVVTVWAEIPDSCARCEKGAVGDLFTPYARADRFVRSLRLRPPP